MDAQLSPLAIDREDAAMIGPNCAPSYLARLLDAAVGRLDAGQTLTAVDVAAIREAAARVDEYGSDQDEDYFGPDGRPPRSEGR